MDVKVERDDGGYARDEEVRARCREMVVRTPRSIREVTFDEPGQMFVHY